MSSTKNRSGSRTAIQLRELRDNLGITQQQLAEKLSVAVSSIQKWERGRHVPHPGTLSKIAALAATSAKTRRVSDETRMQLFTALDTILERAPSAIIEKIIDVLSEAAARYGTPR